MKFRAIRRRLRALRLAMSRPSREFATTDKFAMEQTESVPTPEELARIFRIELRDLVDSGELDPIFAERIVDDVFEPATEGRQRRLKWSAWSSYVEEVRHLAEIRQLRRER